MVGDNLGIIDFGGIGIANGKISYVGSMDNFNYKPETTIQEGIDAFVDWYVEYYGVKV